MSKTMNATTPQLKVVDRFYEAYRTCDINNVGPFLSKDYTYKSLPKNSALPDMTKAEHFATYGQILASLTKFEHIFHEVIESPGKVVIQYTALLTPPDGAVVEYDSVTIITLVEEDGEIKVREVKDISDAEKRAKFFKTLGKEGQIA